MADIPQTDIRTIAARIARVTAIYFQLDRLFDDDNDMFNWLTQPAPAFDNAYPVDLLRTDDGIEAVWTVLARKEFCVYI